MILMKDIVMIQTNEKTYCTYRLKELTFNRTIIPNQSANSMQSVSKHQGQFSQN